MGICCIILCAFAFKKQVLWRFTIRFAIHRTDHLPS